MRHDALGISSDSFRKKKLFFKSQIFRNIIDFNITTMSIYLMLLINNYIQVSSRIKYLFLNIPLKNSRDASAFD